MALGRPHPAALGQYDSDRFIGYKLRFIQRLRHFPFYDDCAPLIAVTLSVAQYLFLDQRLEACGALQCLLEYLSLLVELLLLTLDLHFFEFRKLSQAKIQD